MVGVDRPLRSYRKLCPACSVKPVSRCTRPLPCQAETSQDVAEQLAEYLAAKAGKEGAAVGGNGANGSAPGGNGAPPAWWATNSPYTVRTDIAQLLDESS